MDYKVLYRKYRPNDFTNIIGQDYMISILKNAIKNNKISHAYIFSGPRGTGKTSTAKVFAKAINCLNPKENGPCNECQTCLNFKENADIIEIDAASNNGVDEIREIINNIKLAPSFSKYKVYIIDEVHMLSTSAFNALLLTLEEPPKHVVFILATTNIEAVPITILSRCQRFDFHKISTKDILKRLEYVVKEEKINIDKDALEEIAYISDGGMRDALSILDQLSGSTQNVSISDVIEHFGSISKKQIKDLYCTITNNNLDKFIEIMQKIKKISIDYKVLIKKLLELIEEEAIESKKNKNYQGLSYEDLKSLAFELADISNYINMNIDPYILIEITILKYFKNLNNENEPSNLKLDTSINSKKLVEKTAKNIERKDNIEQDQIISREIILESNSYEELIKIRVNNCLMNAKKDYLNKVKENWPSFINQLNDKLLLNLLIDCTIAAASDEIIIITSLVDGTVNLINSKIKEIEEYYQKICSNTYKFIAITASEWDKEKQKYISNLKNNIKYTKLEEPTAKENKKINIDNIEKIAYDIFDKEKIEIE